MALEKKAVLGAFEAMIAAVNENEAMLNELDSTIGDAEHGLNLKRGFGIISGKLEVLKDLEPAMIIKKAGTALAGAGCGSGPIFYGLAIRAAGDALVSSGGDSPKDVAQALEAALSIIKEKGGAQVGYKTMVDAIEPASLAFSKAAGSGLGMKDCFDAAVEAARKGMEATAGMVGLKGRGFHAGERGLNHQDPGATSAYILLKSIRDTIA